MARIAAAPVANQANRALRLLPARSLRLRQRDRVIHRGTYIRNKQIAVTTNTPVAAHTAVAGLEVAL